MTHVAPADTAPVQLRVPFEASSVSVARAQLLTWLQHQDFSAERVEDARVVISELVANSIRHARPLADGSILVTWYTRNQELLVSVTDGGAPTRPRTRHASTTALAGRGMAIVEALAKSWWAEQKKSAATVHACLPVA